MTTIAPAAIEPRPLTPAERREFVQESALRFYRRKVAYSRTFLGLVAVALAVAAFPLVLILWTIVGHGISYLNWSFLTSNSQNPDLFHQSNTGGAANAIVGTLEIIGYAVAMAVPIALLVAIALYESKGRAMRFLRGWLEVMVGMPSLLFGVFILVYFTKDLLHYQLTAIAGSLALAMLMVPLIAVAAEDALRAVPASLPEAALALGAKRSKVMWRVVLPAARPRILTGIMLAVSRAAGETAPLFLLVGTSTAITTDPTQPTSTLPTSIFFDLQSSYAPQRAECWGLGLILIIIVFVFNLSSRIIVARGNKGQA